MNNRNLACFAAAGFIGVALTFSVAAADAKPRAIVVEGKKFDPVTQRRVSYADLNLAVRPNQKILFQRISTTARLLCYDLDYVRFDENWRCRHEAIDSTDDQVAAAIDRAKQKMAGKSVGPSIAISLVIGGR